jgi:hypothetical protein
MSLRQHCAVEVWQASRNGTTVATAAYHQNLDGSPQELFV